MLEPAIQLVCKDIKYGKILIQTSEETGEPQVRLVNINLIAGYYVVWFFWFSYILCVSPLTFMSIM